MASATPTTIAVAVVVAGGRVLVGRRAADAADAAGRDEFPGGMVEAGETAAEAAARECREEAGIGIDVGVLLYRTRAHSSRGPVEILFFRCLSRGDAPPRPPFRWLPIADLEPGTFPDANREVITMIAHGACGSATCP